MQEFFTIFVFYFKAKLINLEEKNMDHFKKCCLEHLKRHVKVPVTLKAACAFNGGERKYIGINNKIAFWSSYKYKNFLGPGNTTMALAFRFKGAYHLQSNRYFFMSQIKIILKFKKNQEATQN